MSRLYDTVEPNVLKEDFLAEVVREQKPRGEAGRLAAEEGIEFNEVTVLRLDFRSRRFQGTYNVSYNRRLPLALVVP
jgi:hypothetical protein